MSSSLNLRRKNKINMSSHGIAFNYFWIQFAVWEFRGPTQKESKRRLKATSILNMKHIHQTSTRNVYTPFNLFLSQQFHPFLFLSCSDVLTRFEILSPHLMFLLHLRPFLLSQKYHRLLHHCSLHLHRQSPNQLKISTRYYPKPNLKLSKKNPSATKNSSSLCSLNSWRKLVIKRKKPL